IFKDADLERQLSVNGHVRIPLLDRTEVKRLLAIYQEYASRLPGGEFWQGTYVSMAHTDRNYAARVDADLRSVLGAPAAHYFESLKILVFGFFEKVEAGRSFAPPHFHPSFVDEVRCRSLTVWIPLLDVNEDNGAVGVIHGSHTCFALPHRPAPSNRVMNR